MASAKVVGHVKSLVKELRAAEVCATEDYRSDPIKAKFADVGQTRIDLMLVIGERELEQDNMAVQP